MARLSWPGRLILDNELTKDNNLAYTRPAVIGDQHYVCHENNLQSFLHKEHLITGTVTFSESSECSRATWSGRKSVCSFIISSYRRRLLLASNLTSRINKWANFIVSMQKHTKRNTKSAMQILIWMTIRKMINSTHCRE